MRSYYKGTARDQYGAIISSASIAIYLAGTTTVASVYTVSTGGTAVDSVTSDAEGIFYFYVDTSDYSNIQLFKLVISHLGNTSTYDNISVFYYDNYYIDALGEYGSGTVYTQATIESALTAIGTVNKVALLLRPGNWVLTSDLTIPANITLKLPAGAIITIPTGKTLTINGPFEAGLYQVFDCVGTGAVYGLHSADVRWFGVTLDYSTDNSASVQKAIDSIKNNPTTSIDGGWVYIPSRCYYKQKNQSHVAYGPVLTFLDGDVNTGTDEITIATHGLITTDAVTLSYDAGFPVPLVEGSNYYAIRVDDNTIKLALTAALATAGTAIDITSATATGTHTIYPQTGRKTYRCLISHTSGVFATDLAAGKWEEAETTFYGGILWTTGTAYTIENSTGITNRQNVHIIDDSLIYKKQERFNGGTDSGAINQIEVQSAFHPAVNVDAHTNWPSDIDFGNTQGRGYRSSFNWMGDGTTQWRIQNDPDNVGNKSLAVIRAHTSTKQMLLFGSNGFIRYNTLSNKSVDLTPPEYPNTLMGSTSIEQIETGNPTLYFVSKGTDGVVSNNAKKSIILIGSSGTLSIRNANASTIFSITDNGAIQGLKTTNGPVGTFTATSGTTTTTVNNTSVTTSSRIFIQPADARASTTATTAAPWVSTKTEGISFVVTHSDPGGNAVFHYWIVN